MEGKEGKIRQISQAWRKPERSSIPQGGGVAQLGLVGQGPPEPEQTGVQPEQTRLYPPAEAVKASHMHLHTELVKICTFFLCFIMIGEGNVLMNGISCVFCCVVGN